MLALVPGALVVLLTVLLLVRDRVDLAALVFTGATVMTLMSVYLGRAQRQLLVTALAEIPEQAQKQAWQDAARVPHQ